MSSNTFPPSGMTISQASQYKVPDMPEGLAEVAPSDIMKAAEALKHSQIGRAVYGLGELSANGVNLKEWEIKQVEAAYKKFLDKYRSPLAEAMK